MKTAAKAKPIVSFPPQDEVGPEMRGADIVVRCLEREGVDVVFAPTVNVMRTPLAGGPSVDAFIAGERQASPDLDGRSVFGWEREIAAAQRLGKPGTR